jgi:TrpR-related protein YerC/YecD
MTWKTKKLKSFVDALLSLGKKADLMNFLRDICTLEELEEISNRWHIVKLLNKGMSYREISEEVGVSTTTVTRIAHWLKNGKGGYKKALENL